jgi:hypothetical protein
MKSLPSAKSLGPLISKIIRRIGPIKVKMGHLEYGLGSSNEDIHCPVVSSPSTISQLRDKLRIKSLPMHVRRR